MPTYTMPFSKITKDDIALVGGKGANLGEMTKAGFPVPNGFCITAETYREVIKHNQLEPKIRDILKDLDVNNNTKLNHASDSIKRLIQRVDIPTPIAHEIIKNYLSLKPGQHNPLVAVRSSATAEDLPDASFAGQQATYLNIQGEANLLVAVRHAWASLFEPRAIFYRKTKGFDHFKVYLAIPVQLMVQSEVAGIMFTINPVTSNKNIVTIESIWGLGEKIVQGAYTPDHYEVEKDTLNIRSKVTNVQTKQFIKQGTVTKETVVPARLQQQTKLSDAQIVALAQIGINLQKHYYFPQDIEWALEDDTLYIVQTRPITTIESTVSKQLQQNKIPEHHLPLLLKGDSASPGLVSGPVKIVKGLKDLDKVLTGDVLVTSMTTPDFVPAMKRAVGIITDKGGQTSHAAIVSRELGVPAIVGTNTATKTLKTGQLVTVNGSSGEVFSGKLEFITTSVPQSVLKKYAQGLDPIHTATKVYVNLGEPELATSIATKHVDGIGLLRAEFMMAQIGTHPKQMLKTGRSKQYIDTLASGMEHFCSAFGYRPVVYRASDFKTNEYSNLIGGKAFEQVEPNPMIGYRGAFRYIHDEKVFEMELEAIKKVRNKGFKNLWLMIPFCRTVEEMTKVKRIVAANGLYRSPTFKLWMMVEIPANVILLEDFAAVGIDGISLGTNDLTMLTLGTDRDNETVAPIYDERNPAVLWMIETAIRKAHKLGLTSSMCGQAPSTYPELTKKLIEWGITSVSISPDVIDKTRQIIAEAESELISSRSRS